MWTRNNLSEAFSKSLKIAVDRQVFAQEMLFEIYDRRNKYYCKIFPTKDIGGITHYGVKENEVIIAERSSKEFKPLQFADFAVGAIREAKMLDKPDTLEILRSITRKDNIRDIRGNYSPLKGLGILK